MLYLDNTFLGGRYDDTLYVKHLPAKTGTLKLYAVGADGSRSLATEAPLNARTATSRSLGPIRRYPARKP